VRSNRGLDIKAVSLREATDCVTREEAVRVVERWNAAITAGALR
jgi:hypothetical protein